jgi:alpha-beta hydrolase superfamily lysophospholipase
LSVGPVEDLSIPRTAGNLAARLHRPAGQPRAAAVVAHGLASSMASNKLTALCRTLAGAGLLALQFDHSGCGRSPGNQYDTSLTLRRDELLAAAERLAGLAPGLPLAYLGSSLGGAAAVAAADLRAPFCLAAWSAPVDLEELMHSLRHDPEAARYRALARDLGRHDLRAVAARLTRVIFVHGERDEVVPARQAREAHRLAREPKELVMIPGADHQLSRPEDQKLALDRTLAWVERFLVPTD